MSKILKLARKFELRMLFAGDEKAGINFDDFKIKAKNELIKLIDAMNRNIRQSAQLREIAYKLPADPFAKYDKRATEGIQDTKEMMELISKLYVKRHEASLEVMAPIFIEISSLIIKQLNASGSDKWGIQRDKFLNLLEVYGDHYTTQEAYGDPTVLNSMAKRHLEIEFGRLTNTFNILARFLRNENKSGALDILKRMSEHGLINSDKVDELISTMPSIGDTSRVTKNMEDHEKANFVRVLHHLIGLPGIQHLQEWNEFIQPSPDMVALAKSIWFTPKFKNLWGNLPRNTVDKVLAAAPSIGPKLGIMKAYIAPLVAQKAIEQQSKHEKMFGGKDVKSPIAPKSNIRELLGKLSAEERAIWKIVPESIKAEVLSGTKSLDDVLEEYSERFNRDM